MVLTSTYRRALGYGFIYIPPEKLDSQGYIFNRSAYSTTEFCQRNCCDGTDVSLGDCVYYENNHLCITPPHLLRQWQQIAQSYSIPSYKDFAQELPYGLAGLRYLRDKRASGGHGSMLSLFFDAYERYVNERCKSVRFIMELDMIDLAERMRFQCIEDVVKYTESFVPKSVFQLCSYLRVFRDESTADEMKPVFCAVAR